MSADIWQLATGYATPDDCNAALLAQAAEIERLKAERARLTPSGQVAEDAGVVRGFIDLRDVNGDAMAAHSRLAAKAQGYEAARAALEEAAERLGSISCAYCDWRDRHDGTLADMKAKLLSHVAVCTKHPMRALEADRDALQAEKDSLTLAYTDACSGRDSARTSEAAWRKRLEAAEEALGDVLPGECGRLDIVTRVKALKDKLDAAVADNAEVLAALRSMCETIRGQGGFVGPLMDLFLTQPHPGAALLKERQEQAETIKALADALADVVADDDAGFVVGDDRIDRARVLLRAMGRLS